MSRHISIHMLHWRKEDTGAIFTDLSQRRISRSLFYSLPVAVFTDAVAHGEIQSVDVLETWENIIQISDCQASPVFDLFDVHTDAGWVELDNNKNQARNAHADLTANKFLNALIDDDFEKFDLPLTILLKLADEIEKQDDLIDAIIDDFIQKEICEPRKSRKLCVSAFLISCISQDSSGGLLKKLMQLVTDKAADFSKDKVSICAEIWEAILSNMIQSRRLASKLLIDAFLDGFERFIHVQQKAASLTIEVLCKSLKHWNEETIIFLLGIFQLITSEKCKSTQIHLAVDDFDLSTLVSTLFDAATATETKTLAGTRHFFNLLNCLVRNYPSFFHKCSTFPKLVSELMAMSKNGECLGVSSLYYRRLESFAG